MWEGPPRAALFHFRCGFRHPPRSEMSASTPRMTMSSGWSRQNFQGKRPRSHHRELCFVLPEAEYPKRCSPTYSPKPTGQIASPQRGSIALLGICRTPGCRPLGPTPLAALAQYPSTQQSRLREVVLDAFCPLSRARRYGRTTFGVVQSGCEAPRTRLNRG
jgi:hypothetical protein